MTSKRIPIARAKELAQKYEYDQVAILARKTAFGGGWAYATYGRNRKHCDSAARWGKLFEDLELGRARIVYVEAEGCKEERGE